MKTASTPVALTTNAPLCWIGRKPTPPSWNPRAALSFADPWTQRTDGGLWPSKPRLDVIERQILHQLTGMDPARILARIAQVGDLADVLLVTDASPAGLLQRRTAAAWLSAATGEPIEEIT